MMKRKSRSKQSAFTLIEVLVALAILAIGLTALVVASQEVTRNILYLRDKTIAHWVAVDVVAEARLGMITLPVAPKWQRASKKMLGETWEWAANIEKAQVEQTFRIHVQVGNQRHPVLIEVIGFMRDLRP